MFTYFMFVGDYVARSFLFSLLHAQFSGKELMATQEQIVYGKQSLMEGDWIQVLKK